MTFDRLEPTPDSCVNLLAAEHQPAPAIDPADTVVVRSLDACAASRAEALALASTCVDLRITACCPKLCQCSTQT